MNIRAAACALSAAILASCSATRAPHGPLPEDGYPGELLPATALGIDVLWQQTVTATWSEGEQTFDAALQVQGDTLLVLGLSPIGQPGFALRVRDGGIEVENRSEMQLPIPARYIVLDVQRVFFPWFASAPEFADGERDADRSGEHVHESWRGGRVVERRFARIDGKPPGEITIRYEWERADWSAPTRAVLSNGWYGYSLDVRTHAETRLAKEPERAP